MKAGEFLAPVTVTVLGVVRAIPDAEVWVVESILSAGSGYRTVTLKMHQAARESLERPNA